MMPLAVVKVPLEYCTTMKKNTTPYQGRPERTASTPARCATTADGLWLEFMLGCKDQPAAIPSAVDRMPTRSLGPLQEPPKLVIFPTTQSMERLR